jgi:flagellar hook-length control protein FliK
MQKSLMFVDLKPLGITPNSQKLAIKMPEGADNVGVNGDSGFSDMMNALMAIKPEQLRNSLEEMEWVKVQGESSGYAPLLDLSADQAGGTEMAQMLLSELEQTNLQQSEPLGLRFVDIGRLEDGRVGFIKTKKDQFFPKDLKIPMDLSKRTISQPVIDSTKEGLSQMAERSTTAPAEAVQTTIDSAPQEVAPERLVSSAGKELSDIHPMQNKLNRVQQSSSRAQIQPTHMVPQTNEDELIEKGTNTDNGIKVSSANKEQTIPPILPEEMPNKSTKPGEPGVGRVAVNQSEDKAKPAAEQAIDQQFGDRNDSDAKQMLRQASRQRQPSEQMRQYFNAAQVDVSSETAMDETDPLTSARQDNRVLFQQIVSRLKSAPVQSAEYASSPHESAPQTSDVQSNIIRQIVQRMSLHHQGSQSTMTLKLKPEFLGNVHMQISTDNQQVVVRMATESAAVKEMVEQGLQHLKTEMQHHGLEIDKFEVVVANDNEESHPGQDWAGFRQALKQKKQNAMKKGPNGSSDERNEISEKKVEARRVTESSSEIDYFA